MPRDEEKSLARKIAESYRASGMSAKVYRGGILVEREGGWEGPFAPDDLRESHLGEIVQVERHVRTAIAHLFDRDSEKIEQGMDKPVWGQPPFHDIFNALKFQPIEMKRFYWLTFEMSEELFVKAGMGPAKERLYVNVARSLEFRGDLWR